MKKEIVTFIHASDQRGKEISTPIIPMGLVALANFLKKHNIYAEVINLSLEKYINSKFDLLAYLNQDERKLFCFDLHWHSQTAEVIRICKSIKRKKPNSIIILGGFTATYFAKQIMDNVPGIDFIIEGDSEIPFLNLVNEITSEDHQYKNIPNLVWRRNKHIIKNKACYITPQNIINELEYSNFNVMKNFSYYLQIDPLMQNDGFFFRKHPTFYFNCGRGCPVNCTFCGGSNVAQEIINKRRQVLLIDHDAVIRELKNIYSRYRISNWHTCFDPFPDRQYYVDLFRKIREENLRISMTFECWALPSRTFIDEFADTFYLENSQLIISPETGSDFVRKMNKGYYYSNTELIAVLEYLESKNVRSKICFTAGLPFENKQDIKRTLKLIRLIRMKFNHSKIQSDVIEMEPCSPWFLDPEKYGIKNKRRTFVDFYKTHQKGQALGYRTKTFSENEIIKIIRYYQKYDQKLLKILNQRPIKN